MKQSEIEKLISEFDDLPKLIRQPTYLELCKYPYSRFEEICSRLLCFYLDPNKEHGFKDLFLSSLLEILEPINKVNFNHNHVKIICEENANGKRLDILIQSDFFVIGIENKITASLYNPLEIYNNRIELYNGTVYRIVLSLREITNIDEKILLDENNFINVTYAKFFGYVKNNLGNYVIDGNTKYLTFLTDFIQTIENMSGQNNLNPQLNDYFYDNTSKLDNLFELYKRYTDDILNIQKEQITILHKRISDITNVIWEVYQGWDMLFAFYNRNNFKIGVEASYMKTKSDPLGIFEIIITTWTLEDWKPYEKQVFNKFPQNRFEKIDNRAILYVASIENNNEELILETLKNTYDYLFEITKQ